MTTLIKAPSVNSIQLSVLSANFASFEWDDVGRNFYYLIELRDVTRNGDWTLWTHLSDPKYTFESLRKETEYQIRVAVSSRGFEMSDWTYSEVFKTFTYNMYSFSSANEITLSDRFIDEKFASNNKEYVDFNKDTLYASLMTSDFIYSPNVHNVSYIRDRILRRREYHEIIGDISKLCTDVDRVLVGYIDNVVYMTERFQRVARVSNNKGQTWHLVELFDGRIGDPISNTVFSQNSTTTFALGYNHILYGRPSSNVRWSSIRERFSQTDVTFTRMDDQAKLGFEIEIFSRYAKLPDWLDGIAEAISSNDNFVYVGGNGKIGIIDIQNSKYDEDPNSPTFNQRIFSEDVITISNDDRIVIKKIDSVGDTTLVLVTGRLKSGKLNKRNPQNIEYCDDVGIYQINKDNKTATRVFGNNEDDRRSIEHIYSNMSTDGKEFFVSCANFQQTKFRDTEKIIDGDNGEEETYLITETVKERGYLNSAKLLMGSWRASVTNVTEWKRGFMKYYNEADFTFMARSGNRSFITTERKIGLVQGEKFFTQVIDSEGYGSENRIMREEWKDGKVSVFSPNIRFDDFESYAGGILIYHSTGHIIGYYEFSVRALNEVEIIWKPKNIMFRAQLIGQTRPEVFVETPLQRPEDPNLVPLIKKMIPENYFRDSDVEQSRYYTFIKNYLEYLSEGRSSSYIGTKNVIRNKDPFGVDSFEYLWSEMYKRNIYLDSKKKEEAVRFFMAHKNDFYSSKGTVASYKFLFKLLYNEDVQIDDETDVMNYYLTTDMQTIDQGIIGQTIFTPTGRCTVNNIDRVYVDGNKRWELSVGSMIGSMKVGQKIRSENGRYNGVVTKELNGKQLLYNDLDYINNGRSYYIMRIKSSLPVSRYHDDIIRFVHPMGVDFKGVVDITLFMNAGLNMKHIETEINRLVALRFDMGIPTHYPDRKRRLNLDGTPWDDPLTGKPVYIEHQLNGQLVDIDVEKYNQDNTVVASSIKNPAIRKLVTDYTPNERRNRFSPTFNDSGTSMSKYRSLVDNFISGGIDTYRYKDATGNPRDPSPENATQKKLDGDI